MNDQTICRHLTVPVIFLLVFACASSLALGQVKLIYDPLDGNVQIDTNDWSIASFSLQNEPGEPSFNTPNTLFSGLPTPLFPPDNTPTQIGWIAQDLDTGFKGVADLGDIFPTGMSQAEVEAFTTITDTNPPAGRTYALAPVPPGGTGDPMGVVVVPEPGAQLLMALGVLLGILSMRIPQRVEP